MRRAPRGARASRSGGRSGRRRAGRGAARGPALHAPRQEGRDEAALLRGGRRRPAQCCSARISVGAISAVCQPHSAARTAERTATIVFPLPTSPCRRRRIGRPDRKSSPISRIAALLGGRQRERRGRSGGARGSRRPPRGRGAATRSALPPPPLERDLKLEELLEDEARADTATSAPPRAPVGRAAAAAREVRLAQRRREGREGERPADAVRQPLREPVGQSRREASPRAGAASAEAARGACGRSGRRAPPRERRRPSSSSVFVLRVLHDEPAARPRRELRRRRRPRRSARRSDHARGRAG